jgi:uncharacterized membrane protein YfcA
MRAGEVLATIGFVLLVSVGATLLGLFLARLEAVPLWVVFLLVVMTFTGVFLGLWGLHET